MKKFAKFALAALACLAFGGCAALQSQKTSRQQCIAQYEKAELGHPGHGIQANREGEGWGKRW